MILLDNLKLNGLLAAIPESEQLRLLPYFECIDLNPSSVLFESGQSLSYVIFPTTAVISLLYLMSDGASVEVSMVGHEGVINLDIFLGGAVTTWQAIVQAEGKALRINSKFIREEAYRSPGLMNILLRYLQAKLTQMSLTAVCYRHHSLEQQLCRWLLQMLDRTSGNVIHMTQYSIALLLGVRREAVTEAALKLQKAGCISYARGHITVINRQGLEQRTCECYSIIKSEFERLLKPS